MVSVSSESGDARGVRDPRKLRLLVVVKSLPSRNSTNKSEALWSVIDILRGCGFQVRVIAWGRSEGAIGENVEIQMAPGWIRFTARKIFALLRKSNLRAAAEALEYSFVGWSLSRRQESFRGFDVCLALNHSPSPSLLALQIYEKWGIPFVVREHQIVENRFESAGDFSPEYLRSLRLCSALFAVSPLLADQLVQLGVRNEVSVIPNSVSDSLRSFDQEHISLDESLLSWTRDTFVFGAWTRWRKIKRLDLLLKSFAKVNEEFPATRLLIAGKIEGSVQNKSVSKFLSKSGLKDSVFIYGQASRPEIQAIARLVDSVVLSSDYETFGLPALEGMFAGKPIATTRSNGPEYLVSDFFLGETSIRGSSEELAKAMVRVYQSRHRYSSSKIQHHARANFSQLALAPLWSNAISQAATRRVDER